MTDIKGTKNPKANLSEKEVMEIRALYGTGKATEVELANVYKVDQATISRVVTERTWNG
jgi:hypothetical protein